MNERDFSEEDWAVYQRLVASNNLTKWQRAEIDRLMESIRDLGYNGGYA